MQSRRRTTIKDIASECGVSLSTVSLVLNNNPRISEVTRLKVLDSVKKHGYQPNQQARGLASKSSRIISVVVPNLKHVFSDVYFGEIVSGIHEAASDAGYKIMLDVANEAFIQRREYLSLLESRRADGMLFIAASMQESYLKDFAGNDNHAFLMVNHYFPNVEIPYLTVDYKQSAELAADHLLSLGHRAIGLVAGTNTYTGVDFRDAFRARCLSHGLSEASVPWEDGGLLWNQEGGYDAAQRLLARHPNLTALMCANDRMAIGAMRLLASRKIRIPEDMSIMGVDDIPNAAYTSPSLTTIRHDLFAIGRLAFERVLALFKREIASCHEVLPAELVVRESTSTPIPRG